jgi:hypothetical protein
MFKIIQRQQYFLLALPIKAAINRSDSLSAPTSAAAGDNTWYGLYVDDASYAPGDTITVYGSAPNQATVYRLVRLDGNWAEITRTNVITVGPQTAKIGSFIEFPALTLSGRTAFTLEGWFHPTLLGGDLTVVAGQVGLLNAAAGIVISTTGQLRHLCVRQRHHAAQPLSRRGGKGWRQQLCVWQNGGRRGISFGKRKAFSRAVSP